jgi:nickel-dependent lactate racemase
MKVTLDFGKTGLETVIPDRNLFVVLNLKDEPPVKDPEKLLHRKLLEPIGSASFSDLCKGRKHACIVVSDKTRPVPNRIILPPLLEILDRMKIRTTILIACGMHSPTEGKELVELIGKDIAAKYEIVNHRAEEKSELVNLGQYGNSVDIVVNRRYMESDLRILTGFIEPHFIAGFSGGRKTICPGIAGAQTMKYAHSPGLMDSPFSSAGVIEKNPFHEFSLMIAKKARVDFIVNVTINRNKEITGIFAGDLEKAHLAGVEFCKKQTSISVPGEADIIVTSNGGHPLDQDLYQTVKGMVGALPAVKKGGTIIIASQCSKGIGSDNFKRMLFEMKDADSFISMINKPGFFCIDQWEVQALIKALRKVKVKIYTTGISKEEIWKCHVEPVQSVEKGIDDSLGEYGTNAKITVIPSGPYVIPCPVNAG